MNPLNTRSVAEDHGALREMARRVQILLGGRACSCGATGCTSCLCREMESFASRLKTHFSNEEDSWSGIDRPRCDRTTLSWIDRLVSQHGELTKRLDVVCSRLAETRSKKGSVAADFATEIRSVLDDLIDHELSEARLFQRSVFESWAHPD